MRDVSTQRDTTSAMLHVDTDMFFILWLEVFSHQKWGRISKSSYSQANFRWLVPIESRIPGYSIMLRESLVLQQAIESQFHQFLTFSYRSPELSPTLLYFYSLRFTIHLIRCLISLYSGRSSGRAPAGEPIEWNASFNFPALDNPAGLERKKIT